MKKIRFYKSEIKNLANKLTSNSELFGDEVDSVISQLSTLSNSANEFGCQIEGTICNFWGSNITVVAMPDEKNKKHSWSF